MKNWLQILLGGGPATPASTQSQRAAEDARLDVLRKKYLRINVNPQGIDPDHVWRPLWREMLQKDQRFILVEFPSDVRSYCPDRRHEYHRLLCPGPTRAEVSAAGGFEAYCASDAFCKKVSPYFKIWLEAVETWNDDQDGYLALSDEQTDCPTLTARLLDNDEGEHGACLVRHHLRGPDAPSQDSAKIQPQPPAPGMSNVLGDIRKRKPPER